VLKHPSHKQRATNATGVGNGACLGRRSSPCGPRRSRPRSGPKRAEAPAACGGRAARPAAASENGLHRARAQQAAASENGLHVKSRRRSPPGWRAQPSAASENGLQWSRARPAAASENGLHRARAQQAAAPENGLHVKSRRRSPPGWRAQPSAASENGLQWSRARPRAAASENGLHTSQAQQAAASENGLHRARAQQAAAPENGLHVKSRRHARPGGELNHLSVRKQPAMVASSTSSSEIPAVCPPGWRAQPSTASENGLQWSRARPAAAKSRRHARPGGELNHLQRPKTACSGRELDQQQRNPGGMPARVASSTISASENGLQWSRARPAAAKSRRYARPGGELNQLQRPKAAGQARRAGNARAAREHRCAGGMTGRGVQAASSQCARRSRCPMRGRDDGLVAHAAARDEVAPQG
jgi:hypothetical protein